MGPLSAERQLALMRPAVPRRAGACGVELGAVPCPRARSGARLRDWPPELWRDATVLHHQFAWFAIIAAPIDIAAAIVLASPAYAAHRERPA
jgi:hypothetical protein